MTDEDDELEELRAATEAGDRLDADADDRDDDPDEFVEAVLEELMAIDAGDSQQTVSVWDRRGKAYVSALEGDEDRIADVVDRLREEHDYPPLPDSAREGLGKSDVVRLALRLGLSRGDPDGWEDVEEARERHERGSL